jgi:TatD DNase family protein
LLTDTHIHLYAEEFEALRQQLVDDAAAAGINRFFLPNIDRESIPGMMRLEKEFPDRCFPMMGLHPCYVKENWKEELAIVEEWWSARDFCAVGEIGIDLYWDKTFIEEQKEVFRRQVALANSKNRPVVIHCRKSYAEIIAVLEETPKSVPQGIFHCFSGPLEHARELIKKGFYLGIGGVVTYPKAGLAEVVREIPLEHLVLETDAPYLAPVPYRGKRNLPSYLRLVAEKVAEIKETTIEEVALITTDNSRKIFGC